jgi:hypothetical protein
MGSQVSPRLMVSRPALETALGRIKKLREPLRNEEALFSFNGTYLLIEYQGIIASALASGHWAGPVRVPAKFVYMLAQILPSGDPMEILIKERHLHVGSCSINCLDAPSEDDPLHVTIDEAMFLEVGRVLKNVSRPAGAANVIFKIGNGCLQIDYYGGGCKVACDTPRTMVAETTAKAFSQLISAHRFDKPLTGTIVVTFNPALEELRTPLAAVKSKFHPQAADQ